MKHLPKGSLIGALEEKAGAREAQIGWALSGIEANRQPQKVAFFGREAVMILGRDNDQLFQWPRSDFWGILRA
jgi:hypothetical protein